MLSKSDSEVYRKACFLNVPAGSELDVVLSYLDSDRRSFSLIVEELLLAVYLAPALDEVHADPKDIYLASLEGAGVLDAATAKLRAISAYAGAVTDSRGSPQPEVSSMSALSDSETSKLSLDEGGSSDDARQTSITQMDKYNSMIQVGD
jgi:hypothetical protein